MAGHAVLCLGVCSGLDLLCLVMVSWLYVQ